MTMFRKHCHRDAAGPSRGLRHFAGVSHRFSSKLWSRGPSCVHLFLVSAAHTPDNSFMGFVSEELNQTERQRIKSSKVSSMAVVYGKEASIWKVRDCGCRSSQLVLVPFSSIRCHSRA